MKIKILATVFLGMLFSCAPVKTKTRFDNQIDFSAYKTFCWLNGCEFIYEGPSRFHDSTAINKVRESIVEELEMKGLRQDSDNPDVLIDFHIIIEEQSAIIAHREYYDDEANRAWDPPEFDVYNYLKGSLIIDMIDNKQSRMVWRSHSIGYLAAFPVISDKQIERSVAEALKDFPPEN